MQKRQVTILQLSDQERQTLREARAVLCNIIDSLVEDQADWLENDKSVRTHFEDIDNMAEQLYKLWECHSWRLNADPINNCENPTD